MHENEQIECLRERLDHISWEEKKLIEHITTNVRNSFDRQRIEVEELINKLQNQMNEMLVNQGGK